MIVYFVLKHHLYLTKKKTTYLKTWRV